MHFSGLQGMAVCCSSARSSLFGTDKYEGQWHHDREDGEGVAFYANGNKYDGQWHMGQRAGQGTCSYVDGASYEGEWLRDQRNGIGTCIYPSGNVYSGEWLSDVRHGKGNYVFHNPPATDAYLLPPGTLHSTQVDESAAHAVPQNTYDGEWVHDVRQGRGECVFSSGDHFGSFLYILFRLLLYIMSFHVSSVGSWVSNMITGEGSMYYYGGAKYQGTWKEGKR